MQSVNLTGLKSLEKQFDQLAKNFPEQRQQLHEKIGAAIKQELDSNIAQSVNDSRGAVRRWQIVRIGSGGGYAAIRPIGEKDGGTSGSKGQGAITNYLSEGHAIRRPKEISQRYRSRAKMLFVRGREFYRDTLVDAEQIATQEVKRWTEDIAGRMQKG